MSRVRGDDLVRVDEQDRQELALLAAPDLDPMSRPRRLRAGRESLSPSPLPPQCKRLSPICSRSATAPPHGSSRRGRTRRSATKGEAMKRLMYLVIAVAALTLGVGTVAAEGSTRPDDRATHGPGAIGLGGPGDPGSPGRPRDSRSRAVRDGHRRPAGRPPGRPRMARRRPGSHDRAHRVAAGPRRRLRLGRRRHRRPRRVRPRTASRRRLATRDPAAACHRVLVAHPHTTDVEGPASAGLRRFPVPLAPLLVVGKTQCTAVRPKGAS